MSEESDFLRNLMFKSIPERLKKRRIKEINIYAILHDGDRHRVFALFVWRRKIKE